MIPDQLQMWFASVQSTSAPKGSSVTEFLKAFKAATSTSKLGVCPKDKAMKKVLKEMANAYTFVFDIIGSKERSFTLFTNLSWKWIVYTFFNDICSLFSVEEVN